jgi:phosphate transport system permease protein
MRRVTLHAWTALAWGAGLLTLALVAVLLGFLAGRGARTLGLSLLFDDADPWRAILGREVVFEGLWPAVVGTLLLVIGCSTLAIPIGVASGIHLAELATPRWRRVFGLGVDLLAGVPSILMGLFGFLVILWLRRTLLPGATTGLLLAMVTLALLALPPQVRLAGPSLGLTRGQTIRHVLLPAASRGILSGVVLAVGRAAEDTAVILLTGVVANAGLPRSLGDAFEALPFTIYELAAEHRTPADLDRAFGAALVLLTLTATLFLTAVGLQRGFARRWEAKP